MASCRTVIAGVLVVAAAAPLAWAQEAALSGTVRDQSGVPVAGASLAAPGVSPVASDSQGRFVLAGLAAGPVVIAVSADGYAPLSETVSIASGARATRDFTLTKARFQEEVTVSGRLGDYVESSASAAHLSARLIEVPQSIAVLPQRFLEDIGALDTKELYRYVSSVKDSPYSSTVVRGFTQREVLVNGARGNPYGSLEGDVNVSGFSTSQFRLTNVERVEVLKGPASVLYGSGEPGGIINYVMRRPKDQFESRVTLGSGGYDQRLGEAEITGPAGAAGRLLYRGAVYFEDRDHFRNNAGNRNVHAVAAVAWKPSPQATLGLDYEYVDQLNRAHRLRGVPVDAAGRWLADYRWTATEPGDFTDLVAHVGQARFDRVFGGGARLVATLRALRYERSENYHEPRGLTNNGTSMQREFRDQFRSNDDWTGALAFSRPFSHGNVRHELALGGDVFKQDHTFRFGTARQQNAGGPVPPIAIVSPVYGAANPAAYGLDPARYSVDLADSSRLGIYAQDLIHLGARWNLLLGGRVDRYEDSGSSAGVALGGDATAVSGRAGLVFKPAKGVSIYASAGNGFNRPPVLVQAPSANGPHDPEKALHFEAGAKSEWLEGRIQLTAAVFDTRKTNVLRPDAALGPAGNNPNAVLATGEARNRGFEVDVAGEPVRRFNLAFNYAYLDSEITRDRTASLVGKALPNAPKHSAGLFTRVDLPRGAGLGFSLEYVGDRIEPFAAIAAPSYTVVDVHYFQQLAPRLKLLVRCENLFDEQYASSSLFAARAGNMPGQPRTFSLALTFTSRRAGASLLR